MNFDDKIWDYLHGKLAGEDLKVFEAEMKNNATFREDVKLLKKIQLSEKLYGKDGVKERLEAIQLADAKRKKNRWILLITIIAILLIGIMIFSWLKPESSSKVAKVYAANTTTYPMSLTEDILEELERDKYTEGFSPDDTTMINTLLDTLEIGVNLYEIGNYEAAIDVFTFYKQKEKDPRIDFLIGKIHLLEGDYEAAIAILEPIDTEQSFIQEIKLHLAVSYILNHQKDAAKSILNRLKNEENNNINTTVKALLETL